jgi:hypothetical protein
MGSIYLKKTCPTVHLKSVIFTGKSWACSSGDILFVRKVSPYSGERPLRGRGQGGGNKPSTYICIIYCILYIYKYIRVYIYVCVSLKVYRILYKPVYRYEEKMWGEGLPLVWFGNLFDMI